MEGSMEACRVRPTPAGFPSRPRRGKWDSARTVHAPSGLPIASRKNGVPPSRPADPREPPRPPIPTVAPVLPFSLSGASRADRAPPPPPLARTEIRRGRTTPTASRADGEAAARAGGARGLLHPQRWIFHCSGTICSSDMENVWNELDDGSQHGFGVASCTPYTDLLGCQMTEGQDEATPHCDVQVSNNDTTESPSTGKRPKKAKQGQVSKSTAIRSSSYTPKEDEVICSAYLNVSKDPVVSVNQPSKTYWERICDYYNENRGMYGQRTISSLQHRWGEISRDTCKFTAFYAEIERKNQSGKNEDDKIKDALQLYNGVLGHSFKFIHCWFILRHEQKWHELVAEKKQHNKTRPEPSAEPVSPMAPATDTPQINAQNLVRPMGRDTAKRLRSANSSASSTGCLEVLQKIHSDRAKYEKRQEEHIKDESKEMVERYERKLRLQEESINFQKDSMNFQKELLTKQVSIQEKMLALQEKERVDKVMMADLDKFPSWVRDYYVIEQKEIAARRLQAGQPSGEK